MKSWPKELKDVAPDGEEINEDGTYVFNWDCEISVEQRVIMRDFLFDLKKGECFEYFHPELKKNYVVKLEGSAEMRVSFDFDPDESKEKTYNLTIGVITKDDS